MTLQRAEEIIRANWPDSSFTLLREALAWLIVHDAAETARADREATARREAEQREQADRDAWAIYLRVGETPLDRLAREIEDNHAVCAVLAHRTAERDALRAELAALRGTP